MAEFFIKQFDTAPLVQATLSDQDGVAINLTGCNVFFSLYTIDFTSGWKGACSILSSQSGIVQYAWTGTNTTVPGDFLAEFEVQFNDINSTIERFPNSNYLSVHILNSLTTN